MDLADGKGKKGLLSKTWDRCKSFSGNVGRKGFLGSTRSDDDSRLRSKSWPRDSKTTKHTEQDHKQETTQKSVKTKLRVAPEGCISILVGPQSDKFVIKTECLNHPLFKMLLEEAEFEYGYTTEGPLQLPCEVDHFIKVLTEMEYHDKEIIGKHYKGFDFVARSTSFF